MTTKTYLWTNTYNTPFPPEFVSSKNKRYIIIEQCKAIYNDTLIGDVIMHADFIERDHYCDYSACFVNEELIPVNCNVNIILNVKKPSLICDIMWSSCVICMRVSCDSLKGADWS